MLDLLDLSEKLLLQHHFQRAESGLAVARRNNHALQIERVGLPPELHGEFIGLGRIEHAPGQFGRFAQRDRQHAGGQRIERAAMPDFDLAVPALAQHALDGGNRLGRAQPRRLVEHDPAMNAHTPGLPAGPATQVMKLPR